MSDSIDTYARGPSKTFVTVGFPVAPANRLEDLDTGVRDGHANSLKIAAALTGVQLTELSPLAGQARDATADPQLAGLVAGR